LHDMSTGWSQQGIANMQISHCEQHIMDIVQYLLFSAPSTSLQDETFHFWGGSTS
jgi:hypothetical protein